MAKIFASFGIFGIVVFVFAMIIFGPFVTIWSVNTLFSLAIGYSFKTWLAAIWLQFVTFGGVTSAINKKKD